MNRIEGTFQRLRRDGRCALVPYLTAGDPAPAVTVSMMHAMVEAGADLIELGVPFSDPMADGPVIQAACERALEHGVSLRDVLALVAEFRRRDVETPVVLMGYLNPIEAFGYEDFAVAALEAGVDGVLTVDLPPEEAHGLVSALAARKLDTIFLVAPTSGPERIRAIARAASGFIYYVSLKGVTGASSLDVEAVAERLTTIRAETDMPLGVGFGIKDAATAARIARVADAVVVGSAVVRLFAEHASEPDAIRAPVVELLRSMRTAMDEGDSAPRRATNA